MLNVLTSKVFILFLVFDNWALDLFMTSEDCSTNRNTLYIL